MTNNLYECKIHNSSLEDLCKSNPQIKDIINNYFYYLSFSIYTNLSESNNSKRSLNDIVLTQVKSFAHNNVFINALLTSNFSSEINNELEDMIKNNEKINIRKAARNVASDLLLSEYYSNDIAIGDNAVRLIYELEIENKLSDKYKTHFNLTPVKDNDQVISYKDKLILDTSRSFSFTEITDGDINGESLFAKMDSQIAMQIITDIKNGLAQAESRQKEFIDVADEIINDEFQKGNITIKDGEDKLEQSFTEKLKDVCQQRGIFFNFNKADRKIKKEPEKLVQQHIKRKSILM